MWMCPPRLVLKVWWAFASLKVSIQQAKAAILYPPRGLAYYYIRRNRDREIIICGVYVSFRCGIKNAEKDAPFLRLIVRTMRKIPNCYLVISLGSAKAHTLALRKIVPD